MLSLRSAVSNAAHRSVFARLLVLAASQSLLGFWLFLWLLPNEEIALERNADGIVVLTGGTSRVSDALELLAAGRGKRLLITGVNPGTTTADIAHEVPHYRRFLTCCVDLDYSALNTLGNAVETRRWALDRGFQSLIIVTSAYHMPRALAEIAHQLPIGDAHALPGRLRPAACRAVVVERDTTRLVLSEYFKYLFAKVRMRFDSVAAAPPAPVTGSRSFLD